MRASPNRIFPAPQNITSLELIETPPSTYAPASRPAAMSAPASHALMRCVCNAKPSSSFLRPTASIAQQRTARRWQSTDAAAPTNPKIATIVDQISQLTLLETADLVSTLKVRSGEFYGFNMRSRACLRYGFALTHDAHVHVSYKPG